jgi:hypothetical protein
MNALPGRAQLELPAHEQLAKLDALLSACAAAREEARKGQLFVSIAGIALTNAAYGLFECRDLYDIGDDVRRELGIDREGYRLDDQGEPMIGDAA